MFLIILGLLIKISGCAELKFCVKPLMLLLQGRCGLQTVVGTSLNRCGAPVQLKAAELPRQMKFGVWTLCFVSVDKERFMLQVIV